MEYYMEYGGAVLSFSINVYQYHFFEKTFNNKTFLTYLNSHEIVNNNDNIKHNGIRNIFNTYNIKNVNYNIISNTYDNIGLGSSSSFYVSLFNIINTHNNLMLNKYEISEMAYNFETKVLNQSIGKQDQYAASIGGINLIEFNTNDTVNVVNLNNTDYKKMIDNLILFKLDRYNSNDILKEMRNDLYNNSHIIQKMVDLTYDLKNDLLLNNFDNIGYILNESWQYKKQLNSRITNDTIDGIYKIGLKNGATGGKLLGAGGGGCLLFYTNDKNKLRNIFSNLEEIKFDIDLDGTKIIYK